MTRDEAREAAKVLLHFADGGDVEWSHLSESRHWRKVDMPSFCFCDYDFRIKPKPAEGWGTIAEDGDPDTLIGWVSKDAALRSHSPCRKVIRWREIEE